MNLELKREDWMADAACRGHDPNMFMPERGQQKLVKEAVKICQQCPVIEQCLDYGRTERYGIWGGLSGKQRRALNKRAA